MRSKSTHGHVVIRIDKGENLIESLKIACIEHHVVCASVSGIGATDFFKCGVFNLETKEYKELEFTGTFEILSLCGNITKKNGETYIHIHITAGDENGCCVGGHLIEARISATCEIILDVIDDNLERKFDSSLGINLLEL